jgi:histidine decarboxylase
MPGFKNIKPEAPDMVSTTVPDSPEHTSKKELLTKTSHVMGHTIIEPSLDPVEREALAKRVSQIIAEYSDHLGERTAHHLGYPYNLDFDFCELEKVHRFSVNNLGDPFVESNYGVHSRKFEIGVLEWFARVWDIEVDDMWGYVTNCGTEGNLHGILTGREVLPDGILYCSRATHYSVPKASRMYRMPLCLVDTLEGGEIDCVHLRRCLAEGKAAGKPAIINVNVGTTVKGAVDPLDEIIAILEELGYAREEYYIHADGALFGMMLPFLEADASTTRAPPSLTFKKPIDSISVSGHKFVGAPVPCGVVMTRRSHIRKLSSDIEYLNSKDATIMGSRNGHAALYLWYAIQKKGMAGFKQDTSTCLHRARALKNMLLAAGVRASLGDLSSTVVFERPLEHEFVRKWQLACEGSIAHVVVMPSTKMETLKEFVAELIVSREKMGAVSN